MHRVRLSIPFFKNAGCGITVIAVKPKYIEASIDPVLESLSDDCRVIRVSAFPVKITRKFGLGNLGYRSWFQIKKAGDSLLRKEKFDLVYFSTTAFPVMTLGRIWKQKFNIPFVLDMQDPWRNDFYLSQPKSNRPPKYKIAHFLDSMLEKWTVPHANGMISVSDAYPSTLNQRYKTNIPSSTITFAASYKDFEIVEKSNLVNNIFKKEKDTVTLVYMGAVTPGMPIPVKQTLQAIKEYVLKPDSKKIKAFFIGTSYASSKNPAYRIKSIIKETGLEAFTFESPHRVGYFQSIKLLMDADALLLPGSIEAGYTASKIYPYILSRKPIFAVTHALSSVSKILKGCKAGSVITFKDEKDLLNKQSLINKEFEQFMNALPFETNIDKDYFKPYTDHSVASKQLDFFKRIIKSYVGKTS
ncbi:hypothetical protein SAMN03080601_01994 [Alkalitalea saponilacus]|uniref:Uncharacterized protein n=2 Tax=Alkalitalea saponilacus TaxID=889453 RepID=A0A1T5GZM6_9BACT|nr:hypothetical protein SAMN03080601_01994 [Alkalitalea saponilacus]